MHVQGVSTSNSLPELRHVPPNDVLPAFAASSAKHAAGKIDHKRLHVFIPKHRGKIAKWYMNALPSERAAFRQMLHSLVNKPWTEEPQDRVALIHRDWGELLIMPQYMGAFLEYMSSMPPGQLQRLKLLLQNLCVATGVRAMPEGPRTPTASPKAARKTPKAVKPLTPAQPQPPLNLVSTLPAAAPEHEHPHFELATPTAPPPIFPHRIYSRKYPMRDLWDGRPPYAKSGHSEVFSSTVADAYATSQDAHLGHDPDVIFRNRARALGSFKIPPFAKLSGYVDKPVTTMSLDYQPISKDDREQALQPRLNVNKFLEAQHRAVMPGGR